MRANASSRSRLLYDANALRSLRRAVISGSEVPSVVILVALERNPGFGHRKDSSRQRSPGNLYPSAVVTGSFYGSGCVISAIFSAFIPGRAHCRHLRFVAEPGELLPGAGGQKDVIRKLRRLAGRLFRHR